MSSTRCTPWLGVTILRCSGLSMCMMSSTKQPAAFTTLRALIEYSSPVVLSTNFTPATLPASDCPTVGAVTESSLDFTLAIEPVKSLLRIGA